MLLEIWIFVKKERLEMPNDEIKKVQKERSSIYGSFGPHAEAVDEIMESLRIVNCKKFGTPLPEWPKGFETAMFYMASKLARLAAAPDHQDSSLDLGSYADLWLEIQKEII